MAYEINYVPDAIKDYREILDYLAFGLSNWQATRHFMNELDATENTLKYSANGFRYCDDPDLRKLSLRRLSFPKMHYFVVYRIMHDVVAIMGIFHMSQDYKVKLLERR